jgi:uncharacterized repeat protein (TIGR01451 family)
MRRISSLALIILASAFSVAAQAVNTINTVAGGGAEPGAAASAYLPQPYAAVRDASGNTYISDPTLNTVFKVTASGTLSAYAGNGINGFSGDGGAATSAQLAYPEGLAIDSKGNLFIADHYNNRIRQVDTSGNITTVAGSEDPFAGAYAGDGGPATNARLNLPAGVAVDASGNIFIADNGNQVVRRVDAPTQIITTYAGNGTPGSGCPTGAATNAGFANPTGVAVDANGNVFVSDRSLQIVCKINTSQNISTYAGTLRTAGTPGQANGDGLAATSALLRQPNGLSADSLGNLYIADSGDPKIRKVDTTSNHIITSVAGTGFICGLGSLTEPACGDGGAAAGAAFNFPQSVFVDSLGNIVVADTDNMRVRVISAGTNPTIAGLAGGGTGGDGAAGTSGILGLAQVVAVDKNENVYALESNGVRLRELNATTKNLSTVGGDGYGGGTIGTTNGDGGPATQARFVFPFSIATDSSGNFYILDQSTEVVRVINTQAAAITIAGVTIQPGNIATIAGNGQKCGAAGNPNTTPSCGDNGPATGASLSLAYSVAVDSAGNVYIADAGLSTVRIVSTTGTITTFAGTPGQTCTTYPTNCGDFGPATSATLNFPIGLAVDASNNVYIADAGDNVIREVTANQISTFAFNGLPTFGGDAGSALFGASMEGPSQLAVDNRGNLYVGGGSDNVVRRIDAGDGTVITVAGDVNNLDGGFSGDGGPSTSALLGNYGLAIFNTTNQTDDLFVADGGSNRIRRVNLAPVTVESGSFTPFGPALAGSTNTSPQLIFFANNGLDDLILTVKVTGSSAFVLPASNGPGGSYVFQVSPGSSGDLFVNFNPPAGVSGTQSATISITTNDAAHPTFSFPVTGTVTPPVTLTINPAANGSIFGSGSGTTILCPGSSCAGTFPSGSTVGLVASPNPGFVFQSWNVANAPDASSCTADTTGFCDFTITQSETIGANFVPSTVMTFGVSIVGYGNGSGTIVSTPSGISCTITNGLAGATGCSTAFSLAAAPNGITLTATATAPPAGSVFAGWLGASVCSSITNGVCSIPPVPTAVGAVFSGPAQPFASGQVFLSADDGLIFVMNPTNGSVVQVLNGKLPGSSGQGGMTFDSVGNLYFADSTSPIEVFSKLGAGPALFGNGGCPPCSNSPNSVVVAPSGNVLVGENFATGITDPTVLQFPASAGPNGTANATFFPAYDSSGSPLWIELLDSSDTIAYTLGGTTVKVFDLGEQLQHPDIVPNPALTLGEALYALRELPDKSLLVAASDRIIHIDQSGNILQSYKPGGGMGVGSGIFKTLNLDPDGVSFWTNDELSGLIFKINIVGGGVENGGGFNLNLSLSSTVFTQGIGGIAVFGQPASGGADVSVSMTAAPSPVTQGANLTYTITVTNNGPLAASGVTMTDALPSGAPFVSASSTLGACSGTTTVTCNLGTMNSAATATITLVVTATASGTLTNTANATSTTADPNALNNSVTTSTAVGSGAPVTLTITTAGTALGTVTDNSGHINCTQEGAANPTGTCSFQYPSGTQVILTESTPGTFAGWAGAPTVCTVAGSTCTVTLTATETVSATFNPGPGTFPLTVQAGTPHTGGGTIMSAPTGITCTLAGTGTAGTCTTNFPAGTIVTLTSAASPGSAFFGWTGTTPTCLSSSAVNCVVAMSAAETVVAEFTSTGATVNLTVSGAGNVKDTANPNTINCTNTASGPQSGNCSSGYSLGTGVTLTETPASGASFTGWGGGVCPNPTATTCTFAANNASPAYNISATFAASSGGLTFPSTTLPAGAVTVPYGADIQITGGTPPYTFAVANGSSLPAGFTLDATATGNAAPGHVLNNAPATAGTFTFGVTVTDSTTPTPLTGNATISLNIAAMPANTQPGLLKGKYAMLLRGFNEVSGREEAIIGSLTFDGTGNITGGALDVNSTGTGGVGILSNVAATGLYVIGSDNRGVMSITPAGQAPGIFTFSVGNVLNGVASTAYMTSFTDDSGSGDIYAGTLRQQDPTSFNNAAFAGTYVYDNTGQDPQGNRAAEIGLTTLNNANAVTSGSADVNDDGRTGTITTITGTYTTPDSNGRSSFSLTVGNSPSSVVVYQISANEVVHLTLDSRGTNVLLLGTAERQFNPGTFSNTSLAGPDIFSLAGTTGTTGTSASIGLFTVTPGTTPSVNLTLDTNDNGTVTIGRALTGPLSIAANGRGTMTAGGNTLIFYLTQPDHGFMVSSVGSVDFGPIVPQVGAPFSTTPFVNNNLFLGQQEAAQGQSSEFSGIATLGSANSLTATDDETHKGGNLFFDQALGSFTYAVAPTGHFTLTSTTQGSSSGYVVSPYETVFLDTTSPASNPGPSAHPHVSIAQSIPAQVVSSVVLAPASLTFNSQTVGTTSPAQIVTLTNGGNVALAISGITVTGTNPGDFAQTNTCPASLAINANCTISVTFTPAAAGARAGNISIADNSAGSPQTVPLSGTGTATTAPAVTLAPATLTFTSQAVGTTSAAQTVTLTNSGNAALTITGVTVTGTNAGDFAQTNTCPASLAASATCTISVTFTPALAGVRTANISIADNAAGSPQTVSLTGTGTGTLGPTPVPLVNQPLVPDAAAPGGAAFTLTVNGTGFVSGATVDWNGSPRTTNFISSRQLTAAIAAADIAAAKTASVTVINPGAHTSNVAFFTVTAPASSASFVAATGSPITVGNNPFAVAVGDFNGDGIQDLAIASDAGNSVTILLGNGDGTFRTAAAPPGTFASPSAILVSDFNGDGKLDLAVLNGGNNTVTILLGNGDGTFSIPDVTTPTTGSNPLSFVAGDFNGDGHVDLAVANYRSNNLTILLGNGDGSFTATQAKPATGVFPAAIVAGDFNKDGKLDLAVDNQCGTGNCAAGSVTILLGDGTGNFTPAAASPATGSGPISMAVADFNGDGNLDLAVPSDCGSSGTCTTNGAVTILLGDGTGNFTASTSMAATGLRPYGVIVGDFNGDGKPDLAIANNDSNTLSILLGDGTGKFTPIAAPLATGPGPVFPAVGDFNNDGRLDIVVPNSGSNTISVFLATGTATGPAITIAPASLTFASQNLNTTSAAQTVTVSNNSASTVTFTSIATTGDFAGATLAQCPSLAAGATPCAFQITFTPTAAGARTGAITFTDNATGSPQTVTLTGTGATTAGTVGLNPASLTFPSQALNTTSAAQTVTVSNTGNVPVGLTGLGITGPFAIVSGAGAGTCTSETNLALEASCTINVTFTPVAAGVATGTLSISDNATGSPQMVALSGTSGQSGVTITIPPGGSTTAKTTPGGTAFYGLIITGGPGVTGTVQLGCIPSSDLITCQVIPSSVTLNGGTTQVAFGIQTFCQGATGTGTSLPFNLGGKFGWPLVILAFAGMLWTLQRNRRLAMTFAMIMLMALGSAACASLPKGPNGATPAGTYSLTLTTSINGQTQTLQNFLTLVVK